MKFRPITWVMIGFVKAWRAVISPLYGNVCKYHPSCSAYGLRSLEVHGAFKGGGLTIWRILRCNPWSAGGYDPVPGTPEADEWAAEQLRVGQAQGVNRDAELRSSMTGETGSPTSASTGSALHTRGDL